jgi:hypothetical protein
MSLALGKLYWLVFTQTQGRLSTSTYTYGSIHHHARHRDEKRYWILLSTKLLMIRCTHRRRADISHHASCLFCSTYTLEVAIIGCLPTIPVYQYTTRGSYLRKNQRLSMTFGAVEICWAVYKASMFRLLAFLFVDRSSWRKLSHDRTLTSLTASSSFLDLGDAW